MKGFVQDIEALSVKNVRFRQVRYTAKHRPLVLMALKPGEEIGAEVRESAGHSGFRVLAGAELRVGRCSSTFRGLIV